MSKEIFKEIPQGFHEQFLDTLQQLPIMHYCVWNYRNICKCLLKIT